MFLEKFTVRGFRSLANVTNVPISGPTILAGHNDGGKSAVLAALAFLLGKHTLENEDRTYLQPEHATQVADDLARYEQTEVEGQFALDEWEQETFSLPNGVQIRRIADAELKPHLEIYASVPNDERLRDISAYRVPELTDLVKELGLEATSGKKPDMQAALRAYALGNSDGMDWLPAPSGLEQRLPALMSFDGKSARPDDAVRTALSSRYHHHIADEKLTGQLRALETEVQERLRGDAQSLCQHIRKRCSDLAEVFVEPDVSFSHGFKGAPLRIARTSGEPVSLDRSGLGSARRISLAIWEWTSNLLAQDEIVEATEAEDSPASTEPPRTQTIVIYDEPDTHLDYDHQRKIMGLIRDQSALAHVGVVVATHSMNLIDGVDIRDVVHLKLESGRTVAERLGADSHDAVDEYLRNVAASVGLRNSILLHERCFLAVEGESEQRAIPLLFRLCEGMSLQAAGIALWACYNNEGALHLASYLAKHKRSVMLVVDADSRTLPKGLFKPERLLQFFGENLSKVVKLLGEQSQAREFEEVFSNEVWASAANKAWPRENIWKPEDFEALRAEKKFSQSVQEMLQSQSASGPGGKPEMMHELALALDRPEDVPSELRGIFAELRKLAE